MKLFSVAAAVVFAAFATAAPVGQAPAKAPGFSDAGKAALSKQMADAVARGDTPGVVEIVVRSDATLFEGAAGKFDIAKNIPMPANAIFNIASMTKPVTSVAIMMLMEAGRLRLDDPVSMHLEGFDKLQVITKFNENDGTYQTRPAKRQMTIRHLLSHTSGIGYATWSAVALRIQESTHKEE